MSNTKSAEKALRQSIKKGLHNFSWKKKIKSAVKKIKVALETKASNVDILNKEISGLQKVLDKAAKGKVIHKNKANRLKAKYAQKISAQLQNPSGKKGSKSKS